MDTKKLDKWADLLLDTGKRNNLVNFKDTKSKTVEVLFPSSDELFGKLSSTTSFEVFDSKIIDESNDLEEFTESKMQKIDNKGELNISNERDSFLRKYSNQMKGKSQILLYNDAKTNPVIAIKNIDKTARQYIEGTGVNVAYMAFGFIHWKENDSSNIIFRAPILLVQIKLNQESVIEPYFIETTEDDIVVNPTFSYKLETEYGVKLPEYNDEKLMDYLDKVSKLVEKLHWTVTSECKIGIFSFLKINMYRDLKDNTNEILANTNVRQLLGEPVDTDELYDDEGTSISSIVNPLVELHSVVDADSSQIEAIEMAKSGKSFVLQGPPGTGKSQTITNIIAECLSDGKKVLFVSEKLAALNVVYDKLKQAGLNEFCLELHSHKANKKDVIKNINDTLRLEKIGVSSKADAEIVAKEKTQQKLDAYARELHVLRPVIEMSLYQMYECYASFRFTPDIEYTIPELLSKGKDYLIEGASLLEQYVEYINTIGYDYKKNPWYGYINQQTSYQSKKEVERNISSLIHFFQALIPLQQEVSKRYEIKCDSVDDVISWSKFFWFASTSKLVTPSLLNREHFDETESRLDTLKVLSSDIISVRNVLSENFDDDIYTLDGITYHKKLTKLYNGTLSRLFNAEYKQLMSNLRLCKKDGKKLSYEEAIIATEKLAFYQQKMNEFAEVEKPIKTYLGDAYRGVETKWDYIEEQIFGLKEIFSYNIEFGALENYDNFDSEIEKFIEYRQKFDEVFTICSVDVLKKVDECYDKTILNVYSKPCPFILEKLSSCLNDIDKLENWYHFRNLRSDLDEMQLVPFIDTVISKNIETKFIVNAFKKQFYYQWINSILSDNPVLSDFNRISQDKAVQDFSFKDTEQFEINKLKIRAKLSSMRPSLNVIAAGSPLNLLLREGEKKRRQKSIRSLLSETGKLVQQIKPCFLMSPLSVSTFLDPESIHFDVVVFDEASQIFPQDAIGAIYRADQMIVVGDSKQMPPTNFFSASTDNDVEEDDDEEVGDVTDFESILDLCSTFMRQLRLCWHYRSRYEQLIAFSNKNFYNNALVTFPSSKGETKGIGVDYFYVDGIFDHQTNRKEAEFVVDLIYKNIEKYPKRSLGVVAFSVKQQNLIEELLSKRRQCTPEKEYFFKNDNAEPFFIKNLESVQGDERDTIIFSVAYGKNSQGRLLHKFGPLNNNGGERRLNVAITRAKYNVQLVSSMHYKDIDLKRTSAEGAKLLRNYLDYAENGTSALEREISVNPFEQFDSDFELEVCEYLRSKGFSVDTQVGCSGFRIDLALKLPDSSDYVLAIECDGATYHSSKNARDRDRLRQGILEQMGWKFYRIWSTDWFKNKSTAQEKLLKVANDAINDPTKNETKLVKFESIKKIEKMETEETFQFPVYKVADFHETYQLYCNKGFKEVVKKILEIEAPLSENLFLKRIVWLFGNKKVTSAVQKDYANKMRGCKNYGIIRKNGFLYLDNVKEFQFRVPGDIKRDIQQIAPEELAAGMLEILKQNMTADKSGLYHSLAAQCGVTKIGKSINESLDVALNLLLKNESIRIDDNKISLN